MAAIDYRLKRACVERANAGDSYRQIYTEVFAPQHTGMSFETFCRKLRYWKKPRCVPVIATEIRNEPETMTDNKPVGVFSDLHIPFNHPNYIRFCQDTFKRYGVGKTVCTGDLVDFHALSRHQTETCARSPLDEYKLTLEGVAEVVQAFPNVDLIPGNHDLIFIRQAATLGIDAIFLKSFSELFQLPKTWRIHEDEAVIDNVLYKHGINCTGKNGALNTAIQERMSTVIGHSHSFGGCQYSANPRDIIFGLNVGCGIDIAAYAFAYGKHSKYRPTLGCGIVFSESSAIFIPMGAEYFRN